MGKIKAPPLGKRMGVATFGEVEFQLVFSRFRTLDLVKKNTSMQDVALACAAVVHQYTGADKTGIVYDDAVQILKSAVQIEWYKAHEREVPEQCVTNLLALIESSGNGASSTGGSRKNGQPKIMDIITDGLLRNLPEQEIISTVHSRFPDARTGPRDLAFYRHKLRKSGHLPPVERRPRSLRKENTMSKKDKAEGETATVEHPTKTIDVLRQAKDEGLSIEQTAKKLHAILDDRPAEEKVIKDVIILGIMDGLDTDTIVKNVHETFADVESVTPRTSAKDVAYYRTRLRKDYNLAVAGNPRKTKSATAEETDVDADEVEGETPAPRRTPRRKKVVQDDEGETEE